MASHFEQPGAPGADPASGATSPTISIAASANQRRLWLAHQIEPESIAYCVPTVWRLNGEVDAEQLKRSLADVVGRHAALRTGFLAVDGAVHQQIHETVAVDLPVDDLSDRDPDTVWDEVGQVASATAELGFDLARPPLWRARLLRLPDDSHALVLVTHRIVADRKSQQVLVRDLLASPQRKAPLPLAVEHRPPTDPATIIGRDALVSHWQDELRDAPTVIDLPADRSRPTEVGHHGAVLPVTLDAATVERLRDVAAAEATSLDTVLLTVYAYTLSIFTGSTDLVVGSTVPGTAAERDDAMGYFENVWPVRLTVPPAASLRQLVRQVAQRTDLAERHEIPFGDLVEAMDLPRELGRHPLVQAVFRFDSAEALDGRLVQPIPLTRVPTPYDVELSLAPAEHGAIVSGSCVLAVDVVDAHVAKSLVDSYTHLARTTAEQPDADLRALPLVDADLQRRLVHDNNPPATPYEAATPVDGLVAIWARRTPSATAITHGADRVTYRQLDRSANGLAETLIAAGVVPDDIVAVYGDRSIDLITAYLGVLRAGAAYLPLDPTAPANRISAILADAKPRAVITNRDDLGLGLPTVRLDRRYWSERAGAPQRRSPRSATNLAYVFYTSGSTGTPKGVGIEHRSLANLATWHRDTYGLSPADVASYLTGIGFDASVADLWPTLTSGAAVAIPDQEQIRFDLAELIRWLEQAGVTICFLASPLAEALLAVTPQRIGRLRYLLSGGDRFTSRPPAKLSYRVVNQYGPTETTVWATAAEVTSDGTGAPTIGRAIANVRAYVLDDARRLVPSGVPGELYLGGVNVARGYLNRPELTAARFLSDPFADDSAARMYRTGDTVRWRADGELQFIGRSDSQVKIRGVRIEIGEIEAVLRGHADVADAAVVAVPGAAGRVELVAFVVPAPGCSVAPLAGYLAEFLPSAFLPGAFVHVDRIPLTANGKIDRKALAANYAQPALTRSEARPPSSATEAALADIWAPILRVGQISVDDNFFELGGDSLMAIQVVSRARAVGLSIRVVDLFEQPTVTRLAARIDARATDDRAPRSRRVGPLPLADWHDGGAARRHCNRAELFFSPPDLDPDMVRSAAAELVRRHDALRLRAANDPGHLDIAPAENDQTAPMLEVVDLADEPVQRRAALITKHAERLQAATDAVDGPTVVLGHFRCGTEPGRLLVIVHRLCVDAVSWPALLAELMTALTTPPLNGAAVEAVASASFASWAGTIANPPSAFDYRRARAGMSALTSVDLPVNRDTITVPVADDLAALLLGPANTPYRTTTEELLLAALGDVAGAVFDVRELVAEVEVDVRPPGQDGDMRGPVGRCTARFPIRLGAAADVGQAVVSAKEARRAGPQDVFANGMARGLDEDGNPIGPQAPWIGFAYEEISKPDVVWERAPEGVGPSVDPALPGPWQLTVVVRRSAGDLFVEVEGVLPKVKLRAVASAYLEALRVVAEHCANTATRAATPSDFPLFAMIRQARAPRS